MLLCNRQKNLHSLLPSVTVIFPAAAWEWHTVCCERLVKSCRPAVHARNSCKRLLTVRRAAKCYWTLRFRCLKSWAFLSVNAEITASVLFLIAQRRPIRLQTAGYTKISAAILLADCNGKTHRILHSTVRYGFNIAFTELPLSGYEH